MSNSDKAITLLEEKVHYLQNIIELLPGNIYWKDRQGRFLGCNDNVAKILKLNSPQDIINKTNYDLFNKELAYLTSQADEMVMAKGQEVSLEEPGLDINGNPAIYLTKKVPLKDAAGKVTGLLGVSIDITDKKLAEERERLALTQAAEAKVKAKAEAELRQAVMILTGSIAHDLRTPITSLHTYAQIIKKVFPPLADTFCKAKEANLPLSPDSKGLGLQLKSIENVGQTLSDITREMQSFIDVTLKTLSRTLRGELTSEDLVPCSIWHCVFNTLERYPFTDEERALVEWDQHHNFEFMGNEVLMIRVLFNLLNNALHQIKKHQRGKIFLRSEEGKEVNILRVKDTAGGASPEVVKHLFEGYQTTKKEGTGVGLAFCKLTLKSFGGDIACHSVEGDYIEFVLSFPKIKSD